MTDAPASSILVVCSANECRSPFAEALFASRTGTLPVRVASAGLRAWGRPMPPVGLRVARERGLELEGHRSRALEPAELAGYDLVLGMTRAHLRELAQLDESAIPRLFTIRGFARWASLHPRAAGVGIGDWLASARPPLERLVSASPDEDVADPIGRPLREWRTMAGILSASVDAALFGLYPLGPVEVSRRPPVPPSLSPSAP